MTAADVAAVLEIAHSAGFERVWVAGGWGVDALMRRQTRRHRDLDLAVDVTQLPLDHLVLALDRHGFAIETDWRPSRVALVAPGVRQVDLHPVVFDADGVGWQANLEGLEPFRYPADAFVQGSIEDEAVDCLSAAQQLRFHSGYEPRDHDVRDIALLKTLI